MGREPSVVSAAEAVAAIESGTSVYLGSSGSVPRILVEALCARGRAALCLHRMKAARREG